METYKLFSALQLVGFVYALATLGKHLYNRSFFYLQILPGAIAAAMMLILSNVDSDKAFITIFSTSVYSATVLGGCAIPLVTGMFEGAPERSKKASMILVSAGAHLALLTQGVAEWEKAPGSLQGYGFLLAVGVASFLCVMEGVRRRDLEVRR
jgi:hypothetical protein